MYTSRLPVGMSYSLQVVLCNKGDIDAVFQLLPSDTQFGPQFSFSPAQGIVIPGGFQAIQVKKKK